MSPDTQTQLENNTEHNDAVIQALLTISELLNQKATPQVLYQKVHKTISKIMDIKNIAIALYDENKQEVTFDYVVDEKDGERFIGQTVPLGPGLTSYLINSKQPQRLSKADILELQKQGKIEYALGTLSESWIGVPFIKNDTIYGVLIVQSYSLDTIYTVEHLKLLTFVAAHLTNVIIHKLFVLEQQMIKQELRQNISLIKKQNKQLESTMSQLKATQKELIQKEKMASLGKLVAGVAHEINTPLGVCVTGITNLSHLTKGVQTSFKQNQLNAQDLIEFLEDVGDSCSIIESNCLRAADLINSFKKMAVDQGSLNIRRLDLKQYIEEILHSLKPMFKSLPHEIKVDCEADVTLESVAGAISQVLTNLIQNSLVHGFTDTTKGHINISVSQDDNEIVMVYRDDGLGMNEDQIKHIFEPFYTTKRNQGGSGLGAHLIYNLVTTTLQGRITLESEVNKGVTYTIYLPLTVKNEKSKPD